MPYTFFLELVAVAIEPAPQAVAFLVNAYHGVVERGCQAVSAVGVVVIRRLPLLPVGTGDKEQSDER